MRPDNTTKVTLGGEAVIIAAEAAYHLLEQSHMILGHVTVVEDEPVSYMDCQRCSPQYAAFAELFHMAEQMRPRCAKCSHPYADHDADHCTAARCDCAFPRYLMIALARVADLYHSLGYQQAIADKRET